MTMIRIAAATLVAGLIALPAGFVQAAPEPANTTGQSRAQKVFDRLDTSKDGFIDLAELKAARVAVFDRLDVNKDGQLTPEEMRSGRPSRRQRSGNAQRTISRDEFIARAERSLARRDTDKDGRLSFAEFSQRRTRKAPAPTR
ncbi:MAG: EF-hand domain-containing protein [Reyranellaceae bacterium]